MPRPVCGTCCREMELTRSGVIVQINAFAAYPHTPGENQGAYQQWRGDEAICRGCGATVVFRYADVASWRIPFPVRELETPDFVVLERREHRRMRNL